MKQALNRQVVVTGIGIVSPLGNTLDAVTESLRTGRSAVTFDSIFKEHGFACQVSARVQGFQLPANMDKRIKSAFCEGNLIPYAYVAAEEAWLDSGLTQTDMHHAGAIIGTGGPSTIDQCKAAAKTLEMRRPRASPYIVLPTMASGAVAVIATALQLRAMSFAVSAACATSAIAIGEAARKISHGEVDIMFAGGAESADWQLALGFDVMGAMTRKGNDNPATASMPFDINHAGFVLGEGAGILVLEEYERAKVRGAKIYAELLGFGQSSDGKSLTDPDLDGATRAMVAALDDAGLERGEIDYLNTHGTSTPIGDPNELLAIAAVFEKNAPFFSSTKAISGHSLGAAGAHEVIYSLLAMQTGFMPGSHHITQPHPNVEKLGLDQVLLRENRPWHHPRKVFMSNSFGFGGVNATLVLGTPPG
jgi:3-oxoacyl-[acyl-carrier-protein] synthase-1